MSTVATMILPVTLVEIRDLLTCETPADWFQSAPATRVASVILLQQLPALVAKRAKAGRLFPQAMSDLTRGAATPRDLNFLREAAIESFSVDLVQMGLESLPDSGVALAELGDHLVAQPTRPDGSWNADHSRDILARRSSESFVTSDQRIASLSLNEGQGRAVQKALYEHDESMHIQGYPGSGKTHLIQSLASVIPTEDNEKILLLALTGAQLVALTQRIGTDKVHGLTFGQLANEILIEATNPEYWGSAKLSNTNFKVSDDAISEQMGFQEVGNLSRAAVARACRRTVMSFCYSAAEDIDFSHLPYLDSSTAQVSKVVLLEYARRLWWQTVKPDPTGIKLPARAYHLIKHCALQGFRIPRRFKHVIVDEAHDLSPAMVTILDNSDAAVLTMGDKFQRLWGAATNRRQAVRSSELNLTMRAGRSIEGVMNPLIEAHPWSHQEPTLEASDRVQTVCTYYDRPTIPDTPCTILVGSEWHLFEYFQRLSHEGAKFSLLQGSAAVFQGFVESVLDLYYQGVRPRHSALFQFGTWEALQRRYHSVRAFQRIEAMLHKGYSRADLDRSLMSVVTKDKAKYLLGRVDDARNMEFQAVMLTPELLPRPGPRTTKEQLASNVSRLYVGASRAKNHIILPGYMKDWLIDESRNSV